MGGLWVRQHGAGGRRTQTRLQRPFGTRGGTGFDFLRTRRSLLGLTLMLCGGWGAPHLAIVSLVALAAIVLRAAAIAAIAGSAPVNPCRFASQSGAL